jgi:thiol-disulfide isomerase/thioredoxin
MKKIFWFLGIAILIIIIFFSQFGIEIGNVRIGKQTDMYKKQNFNFEESPFNKEYYSGDKLVVLNLWATWCAPCVEEIPILNEVKSYYKNQDIKFISFSIDTDSVKLNNFISKGKFDYLDVTLKNRAFKNAILNTLENKKTDDFIGSTLIPKTYLIKNGKVLFKFDGEITKEELIQKIDKEK